MNIDNTKEIIKQWADIIYESEGIKYPAPDKIVPNKVYLTDDINFIKKYIPQIYSIMKTAYDKTQNGFIIKSEDDLLSQTELIKIVFDENDTVLACCLYKNFSGGNKRFVSGGVQSEEGKKAVQDIIKTDIEPYDGWFWGEVSGPIEHYFKKFNGRPIPKELVGEFLNVHRKITPSPDPNDPVHYTRVIGDLKNPIEKAIYGFKDVEMAKRVMEFVDNYEEFRLSVNSLPDKTIKENDNFTLEDALSVVIQIADFHYEDGINEMLPSWNKQLIKAENTLKTYNTSDLNDNKKNQVKSAIKECSRLRNRMPLLTIHKFKAK